MSFFLLFYWFSSLFFNLYNILLKIYLYLLGFNNIFFYFWGNQAFLFFHFYIFLFFEIITFKIDWFIQLLKWYFFHYFFFFCRCLDRLLLLYIFVLIQCWYWHALILMAYWNGACVLRLGQNTRLWVLLIIWFILIPYI